MNNMNMFNVSSANPNMIPLSQMNSTMNKNQQFIQTPQFIGNNANRKLNLDALSKPLIITGPTKGTSIANLKNINENNQTHNQINNQTNNHNQQKNGKQIYLSQQNPLSQQNHQVIQQSQNSQNNNKHYDNFSNYSYDSNNNYNKNNNQYNDNEDKEEINKIKYLVKDINKHLDDYGPSKSHFSDDSIEDSDIEITDEYNYYNEQSHDNKYNMSSFNNSIKECIIILLLYVLLSQNFIKKLIITSFPQITDEQNNLNYIGHITYGTILALFFATFKNIFL